MKLTPRQQRFVEEYLVDLNAAQAAKRAGYSKKNIWVIGYENLRKPAIADAIRQALDERSERTQVTQDRVILELARIAFADIGRFLQYSQGEVTVEPLDQLSADDRAAIAQVDVTAHANGERTVRLKFYSKLHALYVLAKHLGMLIERKVVSGVDRGPITLAAKLSDDDLTQIIEEVEE
jgi:phage terminase small subunit